MSWMASAWTGFEFFGGQLRAQDDVGVDVERRGDVAGERRAPEPHVDRADALVAVDAEAVERQRQFPAVAVAGAARDHFGEDRCDARAGRGVVRAAGRHEEVDRRRPDVLHPFREQHQSVRRGVCWKTCCPTDSP